MEAVGTMEEVVGQEGLEDVVMQAEGAEEVLQFL